jgi:hypothetical protein
MESQSNYQTGTIIWVNQVPMHNMLFSVDTSWTKLIPADFIVVLYMEMPIIMIN